MCSGRRSCIYGKVLPERPGNLLRMSIFACSRSGEKTYGPCTVVSHILSSIYPAPASIASWTISAFWDCQNTKNAKVNVAESGEVHKFFFFFFFLFFLFGARGGIISRGRKVYRMEGNGDEVNVIPLLCG